MALHPDIKVGSILSDNDCRHEGRTVRVTELLPNGVNGVSRPVGARVTIRADRIHCDSKPRKTGFSLVRGGEAA